MHQLRKEGRMKLESIARCMHFHFEGLIRNLQTCQTGQLSNLIRNWAHQSRIEWQVPGESRNKQTTEKYKSFSPHAQLESWNFYISICWKTWNSRLIFYVRNILEQVGIQVYTILRTHAKQIYIWLLLLSLFKLKLNDSKETGGLPQNLRIR